MNLMYKVEIPLSPAMTFMLILIHFIKLRLLTQIEREF